MNLQDYKYQSSGHSKFRLLFHVSFATKYRKSILNTDLESKFHLIFLNQCKLLGVELLDFAIDSDHVHLIIACTPTISISQFMSQLKSKATFTIRREFPEHHGVKNLWQTGYFIETISYKSVRNLNTYLRHHEADRQAEEVKYTELDEF